MTSSWQALPLQYLPQGVRSRLITGVNGLDMHVLEAGEKAIGTPSLLLLHGFPELAFSWRKVMPMLAAAGFHVIAPDQRGYGRTMGWDASYDGELTSFRMLHLVEDAVSLVKALGYESVQAVIGHDFGSPVAAWCSLLRPDVFKSVVMMSSPFGGPPVSSKSVGATKDAQARASVVSTSIHDDLSALARPRKHYQWYYSTRTANQDMLSCPQGLHAFLRAYYHVKSADWLQNQPHQLAAWSAPELAKLPTYYVMDYAENMAQTVLPNMPSRAQVEQCAWLPERELSVYVEEYSRTGFQGGLQWYRCATAPHVVAELSQFHGRTIDVPSAFIAGASDWGVFQKPGEYERMQSTACTQMRSCHLVPGAGHWVQQEQAGEVGRLLLEFLGA